MKPVLHRSEDTAHPVFAFTAEKFVRPPNGRSASVDRGGRDSWERTIHLDGRPVDRYNVGAGSKPTRPHHMLKGPKGSSAPLVEEVVGKDIGESCILLNKKKNLEVLLSLLCAACFSLYSNFFPRPLRVITPQHTHLFHIQGQLLEPSLPCCGHSCAVSGEGSGWGGNCTLGS